MTVQLPVVQTRLVSTNTRLALNEARVLCVVAGFREGESNVLCARVQRADK
jgi:hypothetical protein